MGLLENLPLLLIYILLWSNNVAKSSWLFLKDSMRKIGIRKCPHRLLRCGWVGEKEEEKRWPDGPTILATTKHWLLVSMGWVIRNDLLYEAVNKAFIGEICSQLSQPTSKGNPCAEKTYHVITNMDADVCLYYNAHLSSIKLACAFHVNRFVHSYM